MGGKGRRRREARRRARQQQQEQRSERVPETENVAAGEPVHAASGAEAEQSRAARKRAKRGGGLWGRVGRIRVSPWLIAVSVLTIGAGILAVLILGSGSSGTTGGAAESTPDPRLAGQTPAASFRIDVDDVSFSPSTISAKAGDVIELVVTNTGTMSHNLRVSGPDKEYYTDDDFGMPPNTILPGETERLLVKIEEPGTYPFRCDFHPVVETGTLVLG